MISRYKRSRLFTAVSLILVLAVAVTGCTGAVSATQIPNETAEGFTPPDIEGQELIASYSLDFSSIADDEARVANIKKAAEMLDGTIFPPIDDSLTLDEDMKRQIDIPDVLRPITEEAGWRNAIWTGWGGVGVCIHENDNASGYFKAAQIPAVEIKTQVGGGLEIAAMAYYGAAVNAGLDSGSGYAVPPEEDNADVGGLGAVNNEYVSDLILRMWVENNCVIAAFYAEGTAEQVSPAPERTESPQVLISSYSLDNSRQMNEDRVYNIEKALAMLDGKVIKPGEQLSVNSVLGERSEANGWKEAPGIVDGGYTGLYGAGVCAVSSALYNAAIRAELDIVEVKHGSIPSSYVPPALDATISSGGPDLVIANPYDSDVTIKARMEDKNIIIEIYGPPIGYTVDFFSKKIAETEEPPQIFIYNATTLPDGMPIPKGKSITYSISWKGTTYEVYKTIHKPGDGGAETSSLYEVYSYPAIQGYTYANYPDPDVSG